MGRGKNTKGVVVKNHKGYNIRMMVRAKTTEGKKGVVKQHTGKFGIYAGKNLIQEIGKVSDGVKIIDSLTK